MLKRFYPSDYVDNVFTIDYDHLMAQGYTALVFDIDNTLVPHGADSTPVVDSLFHRLHSMGFKTLLLSNNNRKRIERFKANFDTLYIDEAGKPDPQCFIRAAQMLGVPTEKVMVIGDQLSTDILGANRAGMASILVKYIGHEKKEWKGFRRYLEAAVLWFYKHRCGKSQKS